jgi:hypothetical protein
MVYKRRKGSDKIGREHKRQVQAERGNLCYMDQAAEINQEIEDLKADLNSALWSADYYKEQAHVASGISVTYIKRIGARDKKILRYRILTAVLVIAVIFLLGMINRGLV